MSARPYRVLGVEVPPMLGRERLFDQLCRHLTKATPDHVSVIGPRLFGKSVMLKHLASHFPPGHFVGSLYWDLRYGTPRTDAEFRSQFARHLKDRLRFVRPDLAEYLEPDDEAVSDLLTLVLDDLKEDNARMLAVLDGFDHLLGDFGITRNLWDELRTLAQTGGLCLVTGSRARLLDLCKDEESRTSNFWQIFHDPPFQVGAFKDDDWAGFLAPFASSGVETDSSAEKEIRNWTGGVPVLAAALADRLIANRRRGETVFKADVDHVAGEMAGEPLSAVRALWDDCPIDLRSLLTELSSGSVVASDVPDRQRLELLRRGFAREYRNGLRSSCGLMASYAHQCKDEVAYLNRLFGGRDRFESNIQGMLELRLEGIADQADSDLVRWVRTAIRDLHPEPTVSVGSMRNIADTALDLIWQAELPADRSLPERWKSLYEEGKAPDRLPTRRGPQCHLLRLVTGTERNRRITKFVTKPTCLLVDHIQSIGNFGQHREGQEVSLPTAASFCLSAIELCARLSTELPR